MTDTVQELAFEHLKSQAQFAYFQLGIAASAIAFAVHETTGQALRSTPWPLGVAVLLWALSFAAGCFGIEAHQRGMRTNVSLLIFQRKAEPYMHDADMNKLLADVTKTTEYYVSRPGRRFRVQLWTIFLGAMFYLYGHVMQMADTNPPKLSPTKLDL